VIPPPEQGPDTEPPAATAPAVAATAGSQPLLEAYDLVVRFGGVTAVDHISLAVPEGGLIGLIGPNGAGKTTTIDALTGFVAHGGRILLAGRSIDDAHAHERARAGLVRTWQSLELFDDLTVRENCDVATVPQHLASFGQDLVRPGRDIDRASTDEAIELLGLGDVIDRHPTELSLGRRKLVAVARALAQRPRLLLLDEPAAGLDSTESLALGAKLREVVDHGVAMLLVDHDMGLVLGVCDRVAVLDFGRVIAAGTPAEIRADDRVIDAYLGASA
jgi:branched-chain amino acid transport system ATP-binding protein